MEVKSKHMRCESGQAFAQVTDRTCLCENDVEANASDIPNHLFPFL